MPFPRMGRDDVDWRAHGLTAIEAVLSTAPIGLEVGCIQQLDVGTRVERDLDTFARTKVDLIVKEVHGSSSHGDDQAADRYGLVIGR